jgi:hypothetical protein
VSGYGTLAGEIRDAADWAGDAVAGGGSPYAALQQYIERGREIAHVASMVADGRITGDDLGVYLGRDGDGATLMVGRPGVSPVPTGRHRRRPWWPFRKRPGN